MPHANPVSVTGSDAAEETSTLVTPNPLLDTAAVAIPDAENTISPLIVSSSENKTVREEPPGTDNRPDAHLENLPF